MLGTRLLELRTEKGLTQSDVAAAIGVSYISIGNYENETRIPNADVVIKLAKNFKVSTDYLLGLTNVKNVGIPNPSNELESMWNMVQKDENICSILDNVLTIIKILLKTDSLYDKALYGDQIIYNEFISNSVSLFKSLTNYYVLCTNYQSLTYKEYYRLCELEESVIESNLNELKHLLEEINDPTLNDPNLHYPISLNPEELKKDIITHVLDPETSAKFLEIINNASKKPQQKDKGNLQTNKKKDSD